MHATFTAVYDSCVLYPAPLRDLLMRLAMTGLFRARWSAQIHEEWISSVLRDRLDLTREQLERTRQLMDAHVLDCIVTGHEALIESVTLPDPNDRHVLAAAIRSGADVIVTFNLNDFPNDALRPFGVEAQHPDEFVTHLFDLDPGAVIASAKWQRASLKNPSKSVAEFLDTLQAQRLPQTVTKLQAFASVL